MNKEILVASHESSEKIIKALNSELRRTILTLLNEEPLNINDIAKRMNIPQSTCTTNIKLLAEAGLISIKQIPARKGSQKVCSTACSEVVIPICSPTQKKNSNSIETEMPIGLYTDFKASPPCGLLSESHVIGYYDDVNSFYDPHRATAQLIWFRDGYLEYRFPLNIPAKKRITTVSVIAELCSEFPGYNNDWPSDITLWINDCEIGTWTSPGDMGGERGHLTPDWWRSRDTQFGFKKSWKVTSAGSYIDGMVTSNVCLEDLHISAKEHFLIRIGIKSDAPNQGGMNIFGSKFGNYDNDIILRLELGDENAK